jgi:hypothetical protein
MPTVINPLPQIANPSSRPHYRKSFVFAWARSKHAGRTWDLRILKEKD